MATKPSNHNLNGIFSSRLSTYTESRVSTRRSSPDPPRTFSTLLIPSLPTISRILHPVFRKPLALFSQQPMTGFYRDGYCRTGPEDGGNHAIAGLLTKEFLDFSASRGNNLRQVPGLKEGCKWCLCTARWKEAMEAAKGKEDPVVPKVFLHATDESALNNGVTMDVLKKYAAEPEAAGGGGSLEGNYPISPGTKGGMAKETH
ncbi:MAG: hypothetical protein Q9226_003326 [Calogaya cf. arnoldii]